MIVKKAVHYLCDQQLASGQFMGYAMRPGAAEPKEQPTTFFTSLILQCLKEVPGTDLIRKRAAAWLLEQRSDNWSWNYWQKGQLIDPKYSYPDDLDDTSCALSALYDHNPKLIDGKVLACLAHSLISAEVDPGGPYCTWLTENGSKPDIDPAVNANIGYVLSLQHVALRPLNAYFDNLIDSQDYESAYYVGQAPVIYFISRWYNGARIGKLRSYAQQVLEAATTSNNALELSLLLSAACNLKINEGLISRARAKLVKLRRDGHWPAYSLYKDPEVDEVPHLAGSAALTTAFALEAVTLSQKALTAASRDMPTPQTYAQRFSQRLPHSLLSDSFISYADTLFKQDREGQISCLATITAEACGFPAASADLRRLDFAGLCGWTAYTIYDHIMDGQSETEMLSVANYALRQSLEHFKQAIPDPSFSNLVQQTLNTVDEANHWEINHARAAVKKGVVTIEALPKYYDYQQLANKSLAHCLTSQASLLLAGHTLKSPRQMALRRFFEHYLIARQLNDDAHDWEADFTNGHLSSVVCLLLKTYGLQNNYKVKNILPELRELFWGKILNDVASLIQNHVSLARNALMRCDFNDASSFQSWLNNLQVATKTALEERVKATDFIEAFK